MARFENLCYSNISIGYLFDCASGAFSSRAGGVMPLSETREGFSGKITDIAGDAHFIGRVTSMGLTVGCPLTVVRHEKKQPILIEARDTLIAISCGDLGKIFVEAENRL